MRGREKEREVAKGKRVSGLEKESKGGNGIMRGELKKIKENGRREVKVRRRKRRKVGEGKRGKAERKKE